MSSREQEVVSSLDRIMCARKGEINPCTVNFLGVCVVWHVSLSSQGQGQFSLPLEKCPMNCRSSIYHMLCALQLFSQWPERLSALSRVQRKTLQPVQAAAFPYGLEGPSEIHGAQKWNEICGAERPNTRFTAETLRFWNKAVPSSESPLLFDERVLGLPGLH